MNRDSIDREAEEAKAERLRLVRLAFTKGVVQWIDDKTQLRIQRDSANQGLLAAEIKRLAKDWVIKGNAVFEHREERANWTDKREFWYFVVIFVEGFNRGLFVEMELTDDDEDCPLVSLLNAHPQMQGAILWVPPK